MAEAPTTIEQAAEGVIKAVSEPVQFQCSFPPPSFPHTVKGLIADKGEPQLTNATRESVGGKFLSTSDGTVLPW